MPDILLFGDTQRSAAVRHEIPAAIGDPFLYAEVDGRPHVMVNSLERDRVAAARPEATLVDFADLGFRELSGSGLSRDQVILELTSRCARQIGVTEAIVDFDFPLGLAERLRQDGIVLGVDDEQIKMRRRVKSEAELAGIRRAQAAADAAMGAAAELLRTARPVDGTLHLGDAPLLAETVRAEIRRVCDNHGAAPPPEVIVASVWQGYGHESGSGPLPAGLPIIVDLWPCDDRSGCWADMTRTFVCGGPAPDETERQLRLVREAVEGVRAAARPGTTGRALHDLCCDLFEGEGYRTQRTGPGPDPAAGFQHSTGHGVGLRVHEDPGVGMTGHAPLVAGDVIAVEPGLWDPTLGGVRIEDLLLITEDGCETLTDHSYDPTP